MWRVNGRACVDVLFVEALEGRRLLSASYHLTFDDEFNTLKMASGPTTDGWLPYDYWNNRYYSGNGEQQYYCNPASDAYNPFGISNGVLSITARPTPAGMDAGGQPYVSGELTSTTGSQWSNPKSRGFGQQYGYFELRAKLPYGKGLWPAFWLLPADASWPPEYDVFEVLGHDPGTIYQTAHWNDSSGTHQAQGNPYTGIINSSTGFHTYGFLWDATSVKWYVDGVLTQTQVNRVNAPMYILINLAVGGYWPGNPDGTTPFPASMELDYMRVYSSDDSLPAVTPEEGYSPTPNLPITLLSVLPRVSVVGTPQITWRNLGQRSYDVTLHFASDAELLDLATIDGDELQVTGPGGALAVTLVSVTPAANGKSADVTYRLAAPGGRWDGADNGSYVLEVPAGRVADVEGEVNEAVLEQMGVGLPGVGALNVVVPGTAGADTISVTLTGSGYAVNVNGMGYSYSGGNVRSILVSGAGGNDTVTLNGAIYICEVSAGAGNDTVNGGSGDDLIRGDEDSDVITGNLGEDTLYGNFGNDSITGAEGQDSLMGGLGADTLDGGLLDDSLYGGDQMDWIYGREGADYIEGRGKADTIWGGSGNDTIYGGAGSDSILGDDGDDRIYVGLHLAFADTVNGGAGTDSSDGDANDVLSEVESVLA